MIECPRLLFPFAREIIPSATRNGGFPPLLLDPIDFVALYQQRVAQQQGQQPAPTDGLTGWSKLRRRNRRTAFPPAHTAARSPRRPSVSTNAAMRCALLFA